jgi:16S rRNA (cytosine967-C5)-methyltransferase
MNALFQHRKTILEEYNGEMPLALYLKTYYRKFPVLGSRDRRLIAAMIYSHFRATKAIGSLDSVEQTIAAELLLCEQDGNEFHRLLGITPFDENADDLMNRIKHLKAQKIEVNLDNLLIDEQVFSVGITKDQWLNQLLGRTAVFIRVGQKHLHDVERKLKKANIEWTDLGNGILKFKQGRQLDQVLEANSYRVQDYSSQKTASFFPDIKPVLMWDVCAGAGGKALLLSERYPEADMVVSDVRKTVLQNLSNRFELYGREVPVQQIIDLANLPEGFDPLAGQKADLILCDVPCSGSGTWGRTPEDFYYFDAANLEKLNQRQFKIASTAATYLNTDAYFLYITCSVFQSENEDIVDKLVKEHSLKIHSKQLINGSEFQADNLFIAVLSK